MSTCIICGTQTPEVPTDWFAFCEQCAYVVGDGIDGNIGPRWKESGYGPFYVRFVDDVPIHGALRVGKGPDRIGS